MAADTLGLMDALGLDRVDLVGASMGGFIAQAAALASPDRLRSLTLLMSSTGSRRVGYPSPKVARRLLRQRSVGDRDAAIAMAVSVFRLIGSPGYVFDEEYLQRLAGRSYDRAYDPKGYLRQLAACLVQQDRAAPPRELPGACTVIHGLHDPLVSPSGGLALARAIPGARFVGYPHGPRPAAGTAVGDCERDRASRTAHPCLTRPVVANPSMDRVMPDGLPPASVMIAFRARPRFLIDTQRQIRLFDHPIHTIAYEYEDSRHAQDLARSFHMRGPTVARVIIQAAAQQQNEILRASCR
jgi:hypothetical protein